MKALIQRVNFASVEINGKIFSKIQKGLLVYVGIAETDNEISAEELINKISGIRIFSDNNDKINLSLNDIDGEMLFISNFTLYGDCTHGFRPSFIDAMKGEKAELLYEYCKNKLIQKFNNKVQFGKFGADMIIKSELDGPINVLFETKN